VLCRTAEASAIVCAFSLFSRKIVTFDGDNGVRIWSESGRCPRKLDIANSGIFAICFVDREHAVCFNAKHAFFFLNLKTGRTFPCFVAEERPHRLSLIQDRDVPELAVSIGMTVMLLQLVVPWRVWLLGVANVIEMIRCDKLGGAARILVRAARTSLHLYSPNDEFSHNRNAKDLRAARELSVRPRSCCDAPAGRGLHRVHM
jgi:hypothetical protein